MKSLVAIFAFVLISCAVETFEPEIEKSEKYTEKDVSYIKVSMIVDTYPRGLITISNLDFYTFINYFDIFCGISNSLIYNNTNYGSSNMIEISFQQPSCSTYVFQYNGSEIFSNWCSSEQPHYNQVLVNSIEITNETVNSNFGTNLYFEINSFWPQFSLGENEYYLIRTNKYFTNKFLFLNTFPEIEIEIYKVYNSTKCFTNQNIIFDLEFTAFEWNFKTILKQ